MPSPKKLRFDLRITYAYSFYMGNGTLTPKQLRILEFIEEFSSQKGYAPSQTEIAAHFGFSSLGTVQNYIVRLERAGFLKNEWNARRALTLKKGYSTSNDRNHEDHGGLQLLGRVAAGRPIEAIESTRRIDVPRSMMKSGAQYFVLEVAGDSMIEEGILDGDFVVVRKAESATEGEIVVALIDNEATIKRLRLWSGRVELHAANPRYSPIVVRPDQDFRIQGVFAGLIRKVS